MAKMRSVQVLRPKGDFELVERDIPEPRAGTVRIKGKPAASATATR